MSITTSRTLKAVLIPLLLAAALLTQGLRLCLHAPHAQDAGHAHATAAHLESDLTLPADSGDDANDGHVTLGLALVKQLIDSLPFVLLPAAMWVLLLPPSNWRFAVTLDTPLRSSDARRLRPPLRAPPF